MLYNYRTPDGKKRALSKPLLINHKDVYVRPDPGRAWFQTTTTVWRVDELIKRRERDWRRLTGEDGHTGSRAETMRSDHDSVYTGTTSIFSMVLMEWIILRYGGPEGGKILDAFAGGPPRGVTCGIMGHEYHGIEIRQEQINENERVVERLHLGGVNYHLGDGRFIDIDGRFDAAITCPPYYDLEIYSDQADDISTLPTYAAFNAAIWMCAHAHRERMKPGAFVCFIVGNFRGKNKELIDFRADAVASFRDAGFLFHQEIILSKNFGSAAKRSTNAWKGKKLVPIHEFLLVFQTPEK